MNVDRPSLTLGITQTMEKVAFMGRAAGTFHGTRMAKPGPQPSMLPPPPPEPPTNAPGGPTAPSGSQGYHPEQPQTPAPAQAPPASVMSPEAKELASSMGTAIANPVQRFEDVPKVPNRLQAEPGFQVTDPPPYTPDHSYEDRMNDIQNIVQSNGFGVNPQFIHQRAQLGHMMEQAVKALQAKQLAANEQLKRKYQGLGILTPSPQF